MLLDLVVIAAPGFTSAERAYLNGLKATWLTVRDDAAACARLGGGQAADDLVRSIAARTAPWLGKRAPSRRFVPLHRSARKLMAELHGMARLAQEYSVAGDDQKPAMAARFTRVAGDAIDQAAVVTDRGAALREEFGRVSGGVASSTWTAAAPPETVAASTPAAEPASASSGSQPASSPSEPTPASSGVRLTTAERQQVETLADLDAWITVALSETLAAVDEPLPWSDDAVQTFCLDMSYLEDACDPWAGRQPAGSHVAADVRTYLSGLAMTSVAAERLAEAALDGSNREARRGAAGLREAAAVLGRGAAGLKSLMPSAFGG